MANIKDVAFAAETSVATVSRYFSSPEKLSKKTAVKVAKAIEELNYKPNLLARNFTQSKSYSILVIAPINNPFLLDVISGIQEVAIANGYTVLLADIMQSQRDGTHYYNMLETRLVDGIIDFQARLKDSKTPSPPMQNIVTLCDYKPNGIYPVVSIDDVGAAEEMVDYLTSLGHKHIGCLSGLNFIHASKHRLKGYQNALKKANIPFDSGLIINGDFSSTCGIKAAKLFANMPKRPTAIFSMSDKMAIGLIQGFKKLGLKVPEDISVVGFDDIEFAKFCDPTLTTIRQPAKELGSEAMKLLCDIIKGKVAQNKAAAPYFLPTELIVRASSAAPK